MYFLLGSNNIIYMYMGSGLAICHWQPNGIFFHEEGIFSCSQLSSVAFSSLCMVEELWAFPHQRDGC